MSSPRSPSGARGQVTIRAGQSAGILTKRSGSKPGGSRLTEAEESGLASGLRVPYDRPSAITDASVAYMRRFVTNASVPPRCKKDFVGTVLSKRFSAPDKTDIKCAEFVESEEAMWVGNKDGSISIFDSSTCEEVHRTPQRDVICCCLKAIYDYVWGGFSDGFVRVLDPQDQSVKINLSRHTGPVTAIVHQPGGKYAFSSSADFSILQWDAREFTNGAKFLHGTCSVRALAINYDLLFSGGDDGIVRVWDIFNHVSQEWVLPAANTGGSTEDPSTPTKNTSKKRSSPVTCLLFAEYQLWVGQEDGTLVVFDGHSGKLLETLTPSNSQPVLMMQHVGSTVWTSSLGVVSVWDGISRQLLTQIKEHKSYVMCAQVAAQSLVSRVWSVSTDGDVIAWDSESELRGDEALFMDEVKRRSDEVLFLREALEDLQKQALALQDQCNDRVSQLQFQLDKSKEESESRACHIASLQAQLDFSKSEVAKRDDIIAARDAGLDGRGNSEEDSASKNVRRVLANQLQSSEKRLMEAEHRAQKLSAELTRLKEIEERRSAREQDDAATNARLSSLVNSTELHNRELERRLDELTSKSARDETENVMLRESITDLTTKLEVSQLKIDEAQKLVTEYSGRAQQTEKEKQSLLTLKKTLEDAAENSAKVASDARASKEASDAALKIARAAIQRENPSGRKKTRMMPILPAKPILEKLQNYVKGMVANSDSFLELPENMRTAMRFEDARKMDPSLDNMPMEAALCIVDNMISDYDMSQKLPKFGGVNGTDFLSSQHTFALMTTCFQLYNDEWPQLSRASQQQWIEEHGVFPSVINLLGEAEKSLASFSTIGPKKREALESAAHRVEYCRANAAMNPGNLPEELLTEKTKAMPPAVMSRVSKDLQLGWKKLHFTYRRSLLMEHAAPFVSDWRQMRPAQQHHVMKNFFEIPSLREVAEKAIMNFSQKDLPDNAIQALKAQATMAKNFSLASMTIPKMIDFGRTKCPKDVEETINRQVAIGDIKSLSQDQRLVIIAEFLLQYTDEIDEMNLHQWKLFYENRVQVESKEAAAKKREEDLTKAREAGATDLNIASATADTADHIHATIGEERWGRMKVDDRLKWLRTNCVFPALLNLVNSLEETWPPANTRPFAIAVIGALRTVSTSEKPFPRVDMHGDNAVSDVMRELEVPFKTLPENVRQVLLRELFYSHVPNSDKLLPTPVTKNEWMNEVAEFPSFSVLHGADIFKKTHANGYTGLGRYLRLYLLASCMALPPAGCDPAQDNIPMTGRAELAERFENQYRGSIEGLVAQGFGALSPLQQELAHHAIMGQYVAGWHSLTLTKQRNFLRIRRLTRAGTVATLQKLVTVNDATKGSKPLSMLAKVILAGKQLEEEQQRKRDGARYADGKYITEEEANKRALTAANTAANEIASIARSEKMRYSNGKQGESVGAQVSVNELSGMVPIGGLAAQYYAGGRNANNAGYIQDGSMSGGHMAMQQTDSLADVAAKYGVSINDLARVNPHITDVNQPLHPETPIYYPFNATTTDDGQPQSNTIIDLARRLGVAPEEVLEMNRKHGYTSIHDKIEQGAPVELPMAARSSVVYGQQPQQSLADVARQHGWDLNEVMRANPHIANPNAPLQPSQQVHMPERQRPETVQQIAQRMNVPVEELMRANPTLRSANDMVQPSQRLVMPPPRQQQQQYGQQQQGQAYGIQFQQDNNGAPHQQTLMSIAEQNGWSIEDLTYANPHITDPYMALGDNDQIIMPARQHAETIQEIAFRLGVPVEEVLRCNPQYSGAYDIVQPQEFFVMPSHSTPYGAVDADGVISSGNERTVGGGGSATKEEDNIVPVYIAAEAIDVHGISNELEAIVTPQDLMIMNPQVASRGGVAVRGDLVQFKCSQPQPHVCSDPFESEQATTSVEGDTLEDVGKRFRVPVAQMATMNPGLPQDGPIEAGKPVILPITARAPMKATRKVPDFIVHKIEEDETLHSVAHKYGVQPEYVAKQMPSVKNLYIPLEAGHEVVISASPQQTITHWMQPTDTVESVARNFGVQDPRSIPVLTSSDGSPYVDIPIFTSTRAPLHKHARFAGTVHVAGANDTLESISSRYGIPVEKIKKDNELLAHDSKTRLPNGRRVMVIGSADPSTDAKGMPKEVTITTTSNEPIDELAGRYGVTAEDFAKTNSHVADKLVIPAGTTVTIQSPEENANRVGAPFMNQAIGIIDAREGDMLSTIAHEYGTTADQLRYLNPSISENRPIAPGTKVVVQHPSVSPYDGTTKLTLGPRDTLTAVSKRYGMPAADLQEANGESGFMVGNIIDIPCSTNNLRFQRLPVESGETLFDFCRRNHSATPEALYLLNKHLSASTPPHTCQVYDSTLLCPKPTAASPSAADQGPRVRPANYIICKDGSALVDLSDKYNVPIKEIMALNPLYAPRDAVPENSIVFLPSTMKLHPTPKELLSNIYRTNKNVYATVPYASRDGESISGICKTFGCSEEEFRLVNQRHVSAHDKLVRGYKHLYIPVEPPADGGDTSDPDYYRKLYAGKRSRMPTSFDDEYNELDFVDPNDPEAMTEARRRMRDRIVRQKASERSFREELERGKALEALGIFAEAQEQADGSFVASPGRGGDHGDVDDENTGGMHGDVTPFLRYKDDKYMKLLKAMQQLETNYNNLESEHRNLAHEHGEMQFLKATRARLVKALFDLYKLSKAATVSIDDMGRKIHGAPQNKGQLLTNLGRIEGHALSVLQGHRTVIVNYLTDAEVYHLGISPNLVLEELQNQHPSRISGMRPPSAIMPSATAAAETTPNRTRLNTSTTSSTRGNSSALRSPAATRPRGQ